MKVEMNVIVTTVSLNVNLKCFIDTMRNFLSPKTKLPSTEWSQSWDEDAYLNRPAMHFSEKIYTETLFGLQARFPWPQHNPSPYLYHEPERRILARTRNIKGIGKNVIEPFFHGCLSVKSIFEIVLCLVKVPRELFRGFRVLVRVGQCNQNLVTPAPHLLTGVLRQAHEFCCPTSQLLLMFRFVHTLLDVYHKGIGPITASQRT